MGSDTVADHADARARLAGLQLDLARALMGHGKAPTGFDADRLSAAALSLYRKRSRAVAASWPGLTAALGTEFRARFDAFAAMVPLPGEGGPLADGRAYARWLAANGTLPAAGRREALAVDARFATGRHGLRARRLPTVRAAWLAESRELVLAGWAPHVGLRWGRLRLGGWRLTRRAHHGR